MAPPTVKPLAQWKTWSSGTNTAMEIADSLHQHIDPTKLPGGGKVVALTCSSKVTNVDLENTNNNKVVEALISAYPANREPSAYLLGDAPMLFNDKLNGAILGSQKANPLEEKARRNQALKQGTTMKMLLAYIRHHSGRTAKGRSPSITYLKELVLARGRDGKKSRGSVSSSPCPSTTSASSGRSAVTLLLDGRPITALDEGAYTGRSSPFSRDE